MTLEEAKEYSRRFLSETSSKAKNVHATSDGSFYMDADLESLASHASANGLEIHTIKGQEIKIESTPQIDSNNDKPAKKK